MMNKTPDEIKDHLLLEGIANLMAENYISFSKKEGWKSDEKMLDDFVAAFRMICPGYDIPYNLSDPFDTRLYNSIEALWSISHEFRFLYQRDKEPNDKIRHFIDEFKERGFSLEEAASNIGNSLNKPSFFDLNYDGETQSRLVLKGFGNKQKLEYEVLLSRVFRQFGLEGYNLNVLGWERLGTKDERHYIVSELEQSLTVQEAIQEGTFSEEKEMAVIDSLAAFNVEGALIIDKCLGDYIREMEERMKFDEETDEALDIDDGTGNQLGDTLRKVIKKNDLLTIAGFYESIEDLTSGDKNYRTEFERRAKRIGLEDSGFIRLFTQRYVDPIMEKGQRVFCHNDFHARNVFENGKILDLEAVSFGALGDDLARYLLSKHTHTGRYDGVNIKSIIKENAKAINHFVDKYNATVRDSHVKYGILEDVLGLKELTYKEFGEMLEKLMMHRVLSRVSSGIGDYRREGEEKRKEIAYANFSVLYNSMDSKERKLFERDCNDKDIKYFIDNYKQEKRWAA